VRSQQVPARGMVSSAACLSTAEQAVTLATSFRACWQCLPLQRFAICDAHDPMYRLPPAMLYAAAAQ
jgi:hypothetical protein